jgi:hypothetical protein
MWAIFVLGAVLSWGAYVPVIHAGQKAIGRTVGQNSPALWAFAFVGLAYFLVAVIVPFGLLAAKEHLSPRPDAAGMGVATLAGALGAVGALCVILALMNGGSPIYVAPLVFAGAPLVATLVSMLMHRPEKPISPLFFVGIVIAAVGAGLVLRFKPA